MTQVNFAQRECVFDCVKQVFFSCSQQAVFFNFCLVFKHFRFAFYFRKVFFSLFALLLVVLKHQICDTKNMVENNIENRK